MRHMSAWGWWLRHRIGILLALLALSACGSGSRQALSTPTLTATPATTTQQASVDQLVRVDTQWQVQITSFVVSAPGDTPNVEQVALGMTLTNQGTQAARLDDKYQFSFRDTQGQRHALGRAAALCHLSTGQSDCLENLLLASQASAMGTLGAIVITGRRDYVLTLSSQEGVAPATQITWNLTLAAS